MLGSDGAYLSASEVISILLISVVISGSTVSSSDISCLTLQFLSLPIAELITFLCLAVRLKSLSIYLIREAVEIDLEAAVDSNTEVEIERFLEQRETSENIGGIQSVIGVTGYLNI